MVSSLGSSRMLADAEMLETVEVFLEEDPAEMPESAESFLVKCLPRMKHLSILMASIHKSCVKATESEISATL